MPEPKPVLGYPSRTAAAIAFTAMGMSPAEIGIEIGSSSSGVAKLLSNALRPPIRIPQDLLDELTPHAMRRGLSATQIVVKLLSLIVDDEMVDAILDDG